MSVLSCNRIKNHFRYIQTIHNVRRSVTAVKSVLDNFEKEGKISPDRKNYCVRELAYSLKSGSIFVLFIKKK